MKNDSTGAQLARWRESWFHKSLVANASSESLDEDCLLDSYDTVTMESTETYEAPTTGVIERVKSALAQRLWSGATAPMIGAGVRDDTPLTNRIFRERHPELGGREIRADEKALIAEWLAIRDRIVRPLLGAPASALFKDWRIYECAESSMVPLCVFGAKTPTLVNPETVAAWRALERALVATGYQAKSAWVYDCRQVAGSGTLSLHSFGLAMDIDPSCNPNNPPTTPVRFARSATRDERCREVKLGEADTIFTPEQVSAVEAIRTVDGHRVFAWGGRWRSTMDSMHFQIDVTRAELARGLK